MFRWLLPLAFAAACLAAYKEASPPDFLILSYPVSDIHIGDKVSLGVDGGGTRVPHDFYGLGYNHTISITYPNGTNSLLSIVSNLFGGGPVTCSGAGGMPRGSADAVGFNVFFTPDLVGRYTAFWNVTYGTSNDPAIANQTTCDVSRLSYQSFIFNASFNVVAAWNADEGAAYTTVTSQFPFEPTGKIFENNGASAITVGVGSVLGMVGLVTLLQTL